MIKRASLPEKREKQKLAERVFPSAAMGGGGEKKREVRSDFTLKREKSTQQKDNARPLFLRLLTPLIARVVLHFLKKTLVKI